jgi:CRISPR-associated protein Cas1
VEGAAAIAVTATATIPQLGFVHEDSGQSFVLDIADLFRDEITIPCAFRAVVAAKKAPGESIERLTRRITGEALRKQGVIAAMIDRIKTLFEPVDGSDDPPGRARKKAPADIVRLSADSGEASDNADDSRRDA